MRKEKFLGNVVGSFFLIFYGSFLLCSARISFDNLKLAVAIFFLLYSLVHLFSFLLLKQKEYSSLFLGIEGIIVAIITFFLPIVETPKTFSFCLLGFSVIASIIKLKKADYFHDHKSKIWAILVSELLLFLLLSTLISINLNFEKEVLLLLFGFYVFFIGVFEFLENLLLNITKGKIK